MFHASTMKTIYLSYAVHGISFGLAVIYTTGDDRQKNTSRVFKGDTSGARLNVPVLHLSPLAFRYAHLNLFIRGSLAPVSCGWPYRQTGREHLTASHTHLQISVVGCGQGDAQCDRSFRSNVSLEYNQPNSQESCFTQLR